MRLLLGLYIATGCPHYVQVFGQSSYVGRNGHAIVIEHYYEPRVQMPGVIDGFSPATREVLRHEIAPLIQWRNLQRREPAYQFDLL